MSDLKIKFGKRLKELRKQKNISQEKFAELINISPRNLSKIETGQTFPSSANLEKIVKSLGCNFSYLFDFDKQININQIRQRFLFLINNLDEKDILNLYKIIEKI